MNNKDLMSLNTKHGTKCKMLPDLHRWHCTLHEGHTSNECPIPDTTYVDNDSLSFIIENDTLLY
jgi:hypothetical protein